MRILQLKEKISTSFLTKKERTNLRQRGIYPRQIMRRVLAPKNQSTNNPACPTETDQTCTAERPSPLPTDVVRLPGQRCRHGGVAARRNKEHAKVLNARIVDPRQDAQADDGLQGVVRDDRPADAVFVAQPAFEVHKTRGEDVRWRGKELGHSNAETEFAG